MPSIWLSAVSSANSSAAVPEVSDPVGTDLFGAQLLRGLSEMAGKEADLTQIAILRVGCEVAHRHVFDHPLAQGRNSAGGRDGVTKRSCVVHGKQRYRNLPEQQIRKPPFRHRDRLAEAPSGKFQGP